MARRYLNKALARVRLPHPSPIRLSVARPPSAADVYMVVTPFNQKWCPFESTGVFRHGSGV
jgi:hypothetical protein